MQLAPVTIVGAALWAGRLTPASELFVTSHKARHWRYFQKQAMAQFVTSKEQLPELAQKLERVNEFPPCFQALFRIRITKTRDGPSIDDTRVERVIVLDLENTAER